MMKIVQSSSIFNGKTEVNEAIVILRWDRLFNLKLN